MCKFLHPTTMQPQMQQIVETGTRTCNNYNKGRCTVKFGFMIKFGAKCRYIHSEAERAATTSFNIPPKLMNISKGFCNFFKDGKCKYGPSKCSKAHLFQNIASFKTPNIAYISSCYEPTTKVLICSGSNNNFFVKREIKIRDGII